MKISKEARRMSRQLFRLTVRDGKLDMDTAKKCVDRLKTSKPRNYLQVLSDYMRLLRLEVEKRHAVVESATDLGDDLRNSVTDDLKKKYGDDVTTDFSTNESLIGGMRIKVGSDVWDGSIKARIDRLRESLAL
ncbi:MAG: F0F1 ATP synthase subunit delta [Verrucomicrobiales bacterium]|nr:F0F1 ATP synthase subunit delta [Verrucomicrobiae bacterium]